VKTVKKEKGKVLALKGQVKAEVSETKAVGKTKQIKKVIKKGGKPLAQKTAAKPKAKVVAVKSKAKVAIKATKGKKGKRGGKGK